MRHVQFNATLKRGQSYIYLEDSLLIERPRLLVGLTRVHGYKRNEPTPRCASGFTCSDNYTNPFEYGHIMSWEVGGPNVVENIVPMYAEWQGSASTTHESWRNMENEIVQLVQGHDNQYLFVAVVEYGNNGNTYPAQQTRFNQWDQLFDWDDHRIPTGFKVYVEPAASVFGQRMIAAFLTPGGFGLNYANLCAGILLGYGGTPAYTKIWDHSTLPAQDRAALLRNVAAFAVERAWEMHEDQKETAVAQGVTDLESFGFPTREAEEYAWAPHSPVHDEAYTFINDYPDEVTDMMENVFNVSQADTQTLTPGNLIYGYYHQEPLKRNVNLWLKRRQAAREERRKLKDKVKGDKRAKPYVKKYTL
jgi:hypothetical protein